jgi:CRISPR type III-associated protein (TIGR04423 family)
MSYFNKIEKSGLQEYSNFNFEGYLWYSDKQIPEVINGAIDDLQNKCTDLPFIVEGYLFCEDNNLSIHIKNYDGKYHIGVFSLDKRDKTVTKLTHQKYVANKKMVNNTVFPGIKFLKFTQVFELKEDIISKNGFKIWNPEFKVFTGFKK